MLEVEGFTDLVLIGRGGFATVYRATQVKFGRPVALKVLDLDLDDSGRRRFERECLASGRLSHHPNVVTVLDAGTVPDGRPYLVLEYLEGGTLKDLVAAEGSLPIDRVVGVGVALAEVLVEAHADGLVHRDIKPANVLVAADGSPRLADFGIARLTNDPRYAAASTASYSPEHVSPEQLSGTEVTSAADVYSLGSTLFALLEGHAPCWRSPEDTIHQLLTRKLQGAEPVWSIDCPARLREVLEACLSIDPADRPTAHELVGRLATSVGGEDDLAAVTPGIAVSGFSAPHMGPGAVLDDLSQSPAEGDDTVRRVSNMEESIVEADERVADEPTILRASTGAGGQQPPADSAAYDASAPEPRRHLRRLVGAGAATAVIATLVILAVTRSSGDDATTPSMSTPSAASDDHDDQSSDPPTSTAPAGSAVDPTGPIPDTPAFRALAVGGTYVCGIDEDGRAHCAGDGVVDPPPDGEFTQVEAGRWHACGLRADGSVECWGGGGDGEEFGQSDPPPGETFVQISARGYQSCGLRADGSAVCWGHQVFTPPVPPPDGPLSFVTGNGFQTCGLRVDGSATCSGHVPSGVPDGTFESLESGDTHVCGLRADGAAACWGEDDEFMAPVLVAPNTERFGKLAPGFWHTCGLRVDGTISCWGDNSWGQLNSPAGTFVDIEAGGNQSCGLRSDGTVTCWGTGDAQWEEDGTFDPP